MALSKVDPNFLNVSQVGGRRNLIINGDHQVQQRGTTFTTSGSDRFASDRWALNPIGASPCSASIQFDSTLQKNTLRVTKETSAGDIQIIQRIEGFKQFHNKQYTLSYYVKANAARTLYVASGFSHAGGFQSIANTSVSGTTQWQRFTHTFSATDLSGYTENSSSNLRIEFRIGDGVTNVNPADYIEFTDVQIELGDTATPFEHRSYGEELNLCLRYFERLDYDNTQFISIGSANTTTTANTMLYYLPKRVNPTITLPPAGTSGGALAFLTSTGGYPSGVGSNSIQLPSKTLARIHGSGYTGLNAGAPSGLFTSGASSILIDAEL